MKQILVPIFCATLSFASIDNISSFRADFTQSVTDDKNATLIYGGNLAAQKPQDAVWHYLLPIRKDVYLDRFRVIVVEPEIEQVIVRKIESNFDFFKMIRNAKKVSENRYEATYKEANFTIITKGKLLESISYKDEFENNVKIVFKNQEQNIKINEQVFVADYPLEFDVIRD